MFVVYFVLPLLCLFFFLVLLLPFLRAECACGTAVAIVPLNSLLDTVLFFFFKAIFPLSQLFSIFCCLSDVCLQNKRKTGFVLAFACVCVCGACYTVPFENNEEQRGGVC